MKWIKPRQEVTSHCRRCSVTEFPLGELGAREECWISEDCILIILLPHVTVQTRVHTPAQTCRRLYIFVSIPFKIFQFKIGDFPIGIFFPSFILRHSLIPFSAFLLYSLSLLFCLSDIGYPLFFFILSLFSYTLIPVVLSFSPYLSLVLFHSFFSLLYFSCSFVLTFTPPLSPSPSFHCFSPLFLSHYFPFFSPSNIISPSAFTLLYFSSIFFVSQTFIRF